MLRALLRQLGARVSRQPNDPPPVRLSCFSGSWAGCCTSDQRCGVGLLLVLHVAEVCPC